METSKSSLNYFACLTTTLLYMICVPNAGLGVVRMYKESQITGNVKGEFFIGVVYFGGFAILGAFHVNFLYHKRNVAHFFNRVMDLNLYFTDGNVHG